MNQIANRKKLRREYLIRKAKAYAGLTVSPLFIIFFLSWLFRLAAVNPWARWLWLLPELIICPIFLVWWVRHDLKTAGSIPYVPPVTADTLPTEEVLVRAADEPPIAQSKVLLRATHGIDTPQEELQRMGQGE